MQALVTPDPAAASQGTSSFRGRTILEEAARVLADSCARRVHFSARVQRMAQRRVLVRLLTRKRARDVVSSQPKKQARSRPPICCCGWAPGMS